MSHFGPSVRVSVDWLDSEAVEEMGADAVMLMLSALAWSARQTTDGRVPRSALRKLWPATDPEDALSRLIKAGEVEEVGEDLEFVHWREFILAADEVERIRELNRIRDQRRRLHNRGDHSMCQPKYCHQAAVPTGDITRDSHVGSRVSHGDLTRPDPTPREGKGEGRGPAGAGAPPAPLADEPVVRQLPNLGGTCDCHHDDARYDPEGECLRCGGQRPRDEPASTASIASTASTAGTGGINP